MAATLLAACSPKITEVSRVRDPSGRLDAIVVIRETDATVATPTEIFVRPAGLAAKGEPIFDADKVEGLKVDWLAADVLRVRAQEARSFLEQKTYVASIRGAHKASE
jgi:hypothetical protein